jgi:mRNA-degrading endonuclease YafQ of YafQ-DinJ toxin-antitoxin module
MKLVASKKFEGELNKVAKGRSGLTVKVSNKLKMLLLDPKHPSLRLHKLTGTNNYSLSVDMSIRIIIHFSGEYIYLLRIGTHEDVY